MLVTLAKKRQPELYRVELHKNGIGFKIKKNLHRHLAMYAVAPIIKERFHSIPCTTSKDIVCMEITFPDKQSTTLDIKQKRRRNEEFKNCVSDITLLFDLLNYSFETRDVSGKYLSKQPQLVFLECYQSTNGLGSNSVEVGLNSKARKLLAHEYQKECRISGPEWSASQYWSDFSYKKDHEPSSGTSTTNEIKIVIQGGGIPDITIPGDCACLGRHPKDFNRDGVLHSSNVNSPVQMLTMIISVISFWNEVLTPLYQKNK